MAVDDVYQISVIHILNGRETSNLFYYKETVLTDRTPKQAGALIAERFFDLIYSVFWRPHVTIKGRLTAISCFRIWPTAGEPFALPFTGETGEIAGDSCPNNACALISMATAIRTRNFQRRSYISGIPESRQIGAELTVVQQLAMGNLANAHITTTFIATAPEDGEWEACAFSKKLAAEAHPDPSDLLTRFGVRTAIRSQRGRNLFFWVKM